MAGLVPDSVGRNLWVGPVPKDPAEVSKHYDALVLAAREFQDVFPVHKYPNVKLILAPMDDSKPTAEEKITALRAAIQVYDLNKKGKRVLVTCAKGVNRSALIAALAMVLSGMHAKEVIEQIQKKRKPLSKATPLFNLHFQKLIYAIDKAVTPQGTRTH